MDSVFVSYTSRFAKVLETYDWNLVEPLFAALENCRKERRQVFLCGNGGSAANALHLANDFLYGISKNGGLPLRSHALSANVAILSCLANDVSYDKIFSIQLRAAAQAGDLLIALSGSGNSKNIVDVLVAAKEMGVRTAAILGYSGGKAKELADMAVHFPIDDMQISEDLQMAVGHMLSQRMMAS